MNANETAHAEATAADQKAPKAAGKKAPKPAAKKTAKRTSKKDAKAAPKKEAKPASKPAAKPADAKKEREPREGSKKQVVLLLLARKEGATMAEIADATGWLAHSIRGFISGTAKKMGLTIESTKNERGERTYRTE